MSIENWGYGETWNPGTDCRRNVRWIAYCNKETFLRTLTNYYQNHSGERNWIKQRMTPTGNDFELRTIKAHPGHMVAYDDRTFEILRILPLIGYTPVAQKHGDSKTTQKT